MTPGRLDQTAGGNRATRKDCRRSDAADESVEELADTGQAYEAEVIEGVEDAADHPEKPVHTREDQTRPPDIASDSGSE